MIFMEQILLFFLISYSNCRFNFDVGKKFQKGLHVCGYLDICINYNYSKIVIRSPGYYWKASSWTCSYYSRAATINGFTVHKKNYLYDFYQNVFLRKYINKKLRNMLTKVGYFQYRLVAHMVKDNMLVVIVKTSIGSENPRLKTIMIWSMAWGEASKKASYNFICKKSFITLVFFWFSRLQSLAMFLDLSPTASLSGDSGNCLANIRFSALIFLYCRSISYNSRKMAKYAICWNKGNCKIQPK